MLKRLEIISTNGKTSDEDALFRLPFDSYFNCTFPLQLRPCWPHGSDACLNKFPCVSKRPEVIPTSKEKKSKRSALNAIDWCDSSDHVFSPSCFSNGVCRTLTRWICKKMQWCSGLTALLPQSKNLRAHVLPVPCVGPLQFPPTVQTHVDLIWLATRNGPTVGLRAFYLRVGPANRPGWEPAFAPRRPRLAPATPWPPHPGALDKAVRENGRTMWETFHLPCQSNEADFFFFSVNNSTQSVMTSVTSESNEGRCRWKVWFIWWMALTLVALNVPFSGTFESGRQAATILRPLLQELNAWKSEDFESKALCSYHT